MLGIPNSMMQLDIGMQPMLQGEMKVTKGRHRIHGNFYYVYSWAFDRETLSINSRYEVGYKDQMVQSSTTYAST